MSTVQRIIEEKLATAFSPSHLAVLNESNNHNVAPGSESHFNATIVSSEFDGKRLLQRHRAVNKVLSDELANHIHALALHTYTEEEWQAQAQQSPQSPQCLGGEGKGGDK